METITNRSNRSQRMDVLQQIHARVTDIHHTMQSLDEGSTLPTVDEASKEILAVLAPAAKYQDFESELRPVNLRIWAGLEGGDWQERLRDDGELESTYWEVKHLMAQAPELYSWNSTRLSAPQTG